MNSQWSNHKHMQNYFLFLQIPQTGNIFILFQIPTTSLQATVIPIIRHIPTELAQESNARFLAPRTITERAMEARYGNKTINSSNHCQSTTELCWVAWTKPETSPRNKQKRRFLRHKSLKFLFSNRDKGKSALKEMSFCLFSSPIQAQSCPCFDLFIITKNEHH